MKTTNTIAPVTTVALETVTGGWHHFVRPGFGFVGAPVAYAAPAPVAYAAPAPVAYAAPAVVGGPVAYRYHFRRF